MKRTVAQPFTRAMTQSVAHPSRFLGRSGWKADRTIAPAPPSAHGLKLSLFLGAAAVHRCGHDIVLNKALAAEGRVSDPITSSSSSDGLRPNDAEIEPGSDREHIEALIRAKGYEMPAGMRYVRFVHLLDEQKRKELLIIYGEDEASTSPTAAELREEGAAYGRWPAIEKNLIERAKKEGDRG